VKSLPDTLHSNFSTVTASAFGNELSGHFAEFLKSNIEDREAIKSLFSDLGNRTSLIGENKNLITALERLNLEHRSLQQNAKQLEERAIRSESMVNHMSSSKSWRLTAPMRSLVRLLR
jgi:hypothetical protein